MFLGELLCLIVFRISALCAAARAPSDPEAGDAGDPAEPFPPAIFALPALCDMLGTCTMYAGLTMTHASVFQMLRGSVVVFTGALSVAFLGRRLAPHHWAGMALVTAGAFLVGLSSVIGRPDAAAMQPSNPFLGKR